MKHVLVFALACLIAAAPLAAGAADEPAPIRALEKQGLEIKGTFDAPGGLTGYAADYKGQAIAIYLTSDSKHAIVGTMVDAEGNNLSEAPLQRLVLNPKHKDLWSKMEKSQWIADGSDDAPRTVYMFMDANCPFCHKFWQLSRPWVEAGKVQLREVMVAVLKPSSLPKGAAILNADDPAAKLSENEKSYDHGGGVDALDDPPADIVKEIGGNTDLMQKLGFYATPTIVYRDQDGNVAVKQGVPQGAQAMAEVMGSPKP
jgi:thiol:disulfide interchange protein DsbG